MFNIEQLHDEAMDLAEEAFELQRKGKSEDAILLFKEALVLEKKAIFGFPTTEPTRSILIRSAASLAFNAEDYEQVEHLTRLCLNGSPVLEIKQELQDLLEALCEKVDGGVMFHFSLFHTANSLLLWNATPFFYR